MKRSEFHKYVVSSVSKALPEYAKYKGFINLSSELGKAINVPILKDPSNDPKISKSLINHFDKLVEDLKNTSKKRLSCGSEWLKPIDQQFEVYKAIKAFLSVAIDRDKHGIRNAYISFTRQRRQRIVRTEENPDGSRRGRPNIYQSEEYRYVVNRAARIRKAKRTKNL